MNGIYDGKQQLKCFFCQVHIDHRTCQVPRCDRRSDGTQHAGIVPAGIYARNGRSLEGIDLNVTLFRQLAT